MKKKSIFLSIFLIIAILHFPSCKKEEKLVDIRKTYQTIISAFTSGVISRESSILVRFSDDIVDSSKFNIPLEKSPFLFKPKIKGVTVWSDSRTLEFRPADRLPSGQSYVAYIDLSELIEITPGKKTFSFEFSTMKQSFEISIEGLKAVERGDSKLQQLSGKIVTADVDHVMNVEKVLSATQAGEKRSIVWTHSSDRREHFFVVEGIAREETESEVVLEWDGSYIEVDNRGERKIQVPPITSFDVLQARAVQDLDQYIEIRFSDLLDKKQDLRGLINIENKKDLKFSIDQNIIRVYSPSGWEGEVSVSLDQSVCNINGHRLGKSSVQKVYFEEVKPQVSFASNGVIIPTTQGLTIPIETINLRAVIVEAIKVYEKNVPQFLQVNDLKGENELERVGRVIWKKVISLDFTPDKKNKRIRYGLDVTPLINQGPGALYRIKLTFRRSHIVYKCPDLSEQEKEEETELMTETWEQESSYWDSYDEDINWSEYYNNRLNPCHPAYYRKYYDHDITASRNVLVSDIGLIAKRGNDNSLVVAASDIKTAQSLSGAKIVLLDYQQQVLDEERTDSNGIVVMNFDRKPFALLAKYGDQSGYLKLDDGSTLSISHFDVSGEKVEKGLKGFIYGERGVWRPGDPIYLTFILLDSEKRLPESHPVIFELRNPRDQLVKTITKNKSQNGFYVFKIDTDPDAPTGNWNAKIIVGAVIFEKLLKVETVMPNRLKIKLDFGKEIKSLSEGRTSGELSATWLHGAIAKNLNSEIELTFSAAKTRFPKYDEYVFDDPTREYDPETSFIFTGQLDMNGRAKFTSEIQARNISPGMLLANFVTRVFEPSGAFSIDSYSIPFHPYQRYIGIRMPKGDPARGMLLTDTKHQVRLAFIDSDGNPVPEGKVKVEMYKIKWRWWWDKEKESFADYLGKDEYAPLKTDTVEIKNGSGTWEFEIKYPSWGRYLIRACDEDGGHSTGKIVYIDWPGWAGRAQKDMPGGASVLTFSADKEEYTVGEKILLAIPTGKKGRALVSLETGTKVLQTAWVEAKAEQTRYEFLATEEMTPNVYAYVTFLQPHLEVGNDLPIRMYGVIPIKVFDPKTRLNPVIKAPDVFRPEENARITVAEERGLPITYTLAVVDEGLLDLTRFATPDPWSHFYQREALGVRTWDVYDLVAGAYGGKLEQLFAIGGGEMGEVSSKKRATRFPPVVQFLGPFALEAGKENIHDVPIPQYVGSVRIMVVARNERAFGHAEKSAFVRKPLMVLGTLPRVLGPEEKVTLPVAVFALEEKVKDVSVSIKTQGPITITGPSQKTISFIEPGDQIVDFYLKAGSQIGVASVVIDAAAGAEKAKHTIEFDPNWDLSGAIEDLQLIFKVGYLLSMDSAFPNWKEGTEFKAKRDADLAAAKK